MKLSDEALEELRSILKSETSEEAVADITKEEMDQFGNFLLYLYQMAKRKPKTVNFNKQDSVV